MTGTVRTKRSRLMVAQQVGELPCKNGTRFTKTFCIVPVLHTVLFLYTLLSHFFSLFIVNVLMSQDVRCRAVSEP